MFISRHTLKWTKTCRSSGDFPHAHTAHFLLNRHRHTTLSDVHAFGMRLMWVGFPPRRRQAPPGRGLRGVRQCDMGPVYPKPSLARRSLRNAANVATDPESADAADPGNGRERIDLRRARSQTSAFPRHLSGEPEPPPRTIQKNPTGLNESRPQSKTLRKQ